MSSSDGAAELLARVESVRAQMAPVRHRVLAAMARRVAQHQGEARRQLLARVEALMSEPAAQAESAAAVAPLPARDDAQLGLSQLVNWLNRHAGDTAATPARMAAPQPLKSVANFQGTWSRLRVEQRLRQALTQVPAQAGPLHSARIVSRALQTLHDLSPAYLDAFMTHVDALQWMEQTSGGGDLTPRASRSRAK
ncbi:DUF2894 domain-containing protein [Piscinibacter gummiphilus]|uniref:DUF2894 domain-containing protein n=1 Tax=Piscinibacter gummiphilus TaxID=946333 RepID=A0ABZ0CZ18_9BURK|nr:DUF2894 domain-containing protein [Piscinibacter gummiphilus]WOB09756.1 DUF2894 domain-containing protein [Piscinibacter gummiphilus]